MVINGLQDALEIGWAGERNARELRLNVAGYVSLFGGSVVPTLFMQRPGETEYYPCATRLDEGELVWVPSAADCEIPGRGIAQIKFVNTDGDVVGMSHLISVRVRKSMPGLEVEEAPEAVQPFADMIARQATEAAVSAGEARTAADEAAETLARLEAEAESGVLRGLSAYEVAVRNGFVGTEREWLESLVGNDGEKGDQGDRGEKGDRG